MMEWINSRNPSSPGLYGILHNDQRWNPETFTVGYWDGKGWKIPGQSDLEIASYRSTPHLWCCLDIEDD